MNEQKSLLTYLSEAVDHYHRERRSQQAEQPMKQSGRAGRLARWLLPNGGTLILIALLIATQSVWARGLQGPAAPGSSATTVNYQGRLADNGGTPINGTRSMIFAIYDAASGGNLIWGPETHAAVPVGNGLFSVGLGSQTSGGIPTITWNGDRYLEITVGGETLSPRELIRSVPIAGMALTVPDKAVTSRKLQLTTEWVSAPVTVQVTAQYQKVATATVTVDVSSKLIVFATCDCETAEGAFVMGNVTVDGNINNTHGLFAGAWPPGSASVSLRQTVSNSYVFDVEPGSHTIVLQVALYNGTGTAHAFETHSGMTYLVTAR